MLQQTQVRTVIPYYHRFLNLFPTVRSLSIASLEDVLKAWENLGYYSRARNLHRAAIQIVARFGGNLPENRQDLLSLPGIGEYTAGAILSMAFGKKVAAVDANVKRVTLRLFAIDNSKNDSMVRRQVQSLVESILSTKHPGEFNQALMDLGSAVCIPGKPRCFSCPLCNSCVARAQGVQDILPRRYSRPLVPYRESTAALIQRRNGQILMLRRPENGLLGSLWKLPGGFRHEGESLKTTLHRTIKEEVGIEVAVRQEITSIFHAYTHFRLRLHSFLCSLEDGVLIDKAVIFRWIDPNDISKIPLSKADRMVLERSLKAIKQ
jgi:A/G-specific adenine glycosylase